MSSLSCAISIMLLSTLLLAGHHHHLNAGVISQGVVWFETNYFCIQRFPLSACLLLVLFSLATLNLAFIKLYVSTICMVAILLKSS